MKVRMIAWVLVMGWLTACSEPAENDVEAMVTREQGEAHFHNGYFAMAVVKPDGWYAQSAEETMALTMMASPMLAGSDQSREAMIKASMAATVPLFGFFMVPPGTPGTLNPNVIANAENVKALPGITSGCDYLFHSAQLIRQSSFEVVTISDCRAEQLAGRPFGTLDVHMRLNGQDIHQRLHTTLTRGYALSVVETWFDDASKKAVGEVVSSLQFAVQ